MTPQRPALAEVLAALDAPTADGLTVGDGPAMSPVEAVEALATARMWPWEPGEGPRWRCEACCGCGGMDGIGGYVDCDACASTGDSTAPPTLAALVAVASLGAPQLARYVHVAGEIARAAGCTGAVVVWRVMTREALRKHCDAAHPRGDEGFSPVTFFAHQVRWEMRGLKVDFEKGEGFGRAIIEATWPMLRDLHAGDVHLVELDASRIVLAVEAIGGDRG